MLHFNHSNDSSHDNVNSDAPNPDLLTDGPDTTHHLQDNTIEALNKLSSDSSLTTQPLIEATHESVASLSQEIESNGIPLTPTIQHYSWGKPADTSLVAALSPQVDTTVPYAELWVGDHPKAPNTLPSLGHEALPILFETNAQLLGDTILSRFGPTLPFLFKILSIDSPLSIQAHPDKQLAEILHKRFPEHYPDNNHKPEAALALSEVGLLYGFRNDADLLTQIKGTPELEKVLNSTTYEALLDPTARSAFHRSILQAAYSELMTAPTATITEATNELILRLSQSNSLSEADRWVLRTAPHFPASPGLFAFYLMNIETLTPGEVLFIPANTPHAYLYGDLAEVMTASDNVVRAGLTRKYTDANTLLFMLDYHQGPANRIPPLLDTYTSDGSLLRYTFPVDEFGLEVYQGTIKSSPSSPESASLIFCLKGSIHIQNEGNSTRPLPALELQPGQAALIPASSNKQTISVSNGVSFRTFLP